MKSLCKHVGRESRFMGLCYECAPMRDSGSAEVRDVLLRYARGVREKEKLRQRAFRLRISGILSGSAPAPVATPPLRPVLVEEDDAETKAEMETPAYKDYQAEVQRNVAEMLAEKPADAPVEEEDEAVELTAEELVALGERDKKLADEKRKVAPTALTCGMLTEEELAEYTGEMDEFLSEADQTTSAMDAKQADLLAMFTQRRALVPVKEGV